MTQPLGRDLVADIKRIAREYYVATGRPLGVTGQLAEHEAADLLHLDLAPPRTKGYDAVRRGARGEEKLQIKSRRFKEAHARGGRTPRIDDGPFDSVLLVLFDPYYEVREIWEASRRDVLARLDEPGSKSRNVGRSMGVAQFISIAERVWP